jgi:rod shape-determining protein MreC
MPATTNRTNRRGAGRWWWLFGRLLLVGTVLAAIAMMILNRTAPDTAKQLRSNATDWASPLLDVVTAPVRGLSSAWDWTASFFTRAATFRTLQSENIQLKLERERARELSVQHAQLRQLLKVSEPTSGTVRVARIVGASAGSYLQSAIITAGNHQGVKPNQPIRDAEGIVGQVIEVGRWSSRVLLITDSQSRIPVRSVRTSQLGYAAGQNASLLVVTMAEPGSDIASGDLFVTSGEGGIFPPGIPVGKIAAILKGEAQLTAAAQLRRLNYALILRPFVPENTLPTAIIDPASAPEAVETTPPAP